MEGKFQEGRFLADVLGASQIIYTFASGGDIRHYSEILF